MSGLIEQLDPLFTQIVDGIGELEGNESCADLFDSEQNRRVEDGWCHEPGYFTIPGSHPWETQALYVAMHPTHPDWYEQTVTNADRERLMQEALTTTWNQSHDSWVNSAVPTVYRSASQDVWEPDPSAMEAPVQALSDLTRWLAGQLEPGAGWTSPDDPEAPQWLADLRQHWPATSQSSESFYDFWNDVNDKCSLYLHAAARLASSSAQVGAALSDYQTNLLEATEKCRDRVTEALEQWQAWKDRSGAWPTGAMTDNSGAKDILGHVSTVTGLVALFPPAAAVSGGVSLVTGLVTYIIPDKSIEMEVLSAATASEIHNGFLNDLKRIAEEMGKALDGLRTEPPADAGTFAHQGLESYANDVVANRRDWTPPTVHI
ncbi:hypothetical protein IEZ26_11300 [Nocardioides cavernae]|uniref:WXG100 family type VII secretion target n=1 Tax=Nocardioides cavernae TaxID=1921566 RepID=A0ABR8NAQ5_9ACTN|nr:hypothetical protein [Nocardioides cavernae]MBD3925211.1 hypothetical protein [Nocardioides cavernae]MBM7514410.1 hypothetical protein [Nocardioides cavernae]